MSTYQGLNCVSLPENIQGCDLSHVICDPEAGSVIKTYSPDLIVHPILNKNKSVPKLIISLVIIMDADDVGHNSDREAINSELKDVMSRLHVIIIGPGLGRADHMQDFARTAISFAREQNKYIVLDADSLWLIQKHPEYIKGYPKAVLTPNVVEFGRLRDALVRMIHSVYLKAALCGTKEKLFETKAYPERRATRLTGFQDCA
jgi:ATP-dependent NAD(P)H-hydrate dehydratase